MVKRQHHNSLALGTTVAQQATADRIRELTKAGALIAAEIDRLQRKAERDE